MRCSQFENLIDEAVKLDDIMRSVANKEGYVPVSVLAPKLVPVPVPVPVHVPVLTVCRTIKWTFRQPRTFYLGPLFDRLGTPSTSHPNPSPLPSPLQQSTSSMRTWSRTSSSRSRSSPRSSPSSPSGPRSRSSPPPPRSPYLPSFRIAPLLFHFCISCVSLFLSVCAFVLTIRYGRCL